MRTKINAIDRIRVPLVASLVHCPRNITEHTLSVSLSMQDAEDWHDVFADLEALTEVDLRNFTMSHVILVSPDMASSRALMPPSLAPSLPPPDVSQVI